MSALEYYACRANTNGINAMNDEQKVMIDGVEYALSSLSDEAKKAFSMLKVTDHEIQRLQAQLAIAQTARMVYAKSLKDHLPPPMGETLAVSSIAK